jgi:hypothetical protein
VVRTGPVPTGIAGDWQWRSEGRRPDGDLEVAVEDWTLALDGQKVAGHYDRALTVTSAAGRVFACNRGESYVRRTRYYVSGRYEGGQLTLAEDRFEAAPSLCDDGARELASYTGTLKDGRLELSRGGSPEVLSPRTSSAPSWQDFVRAPSAKDLGGLWQRVLSRRDDSGQLRTEYEVWHLGPAPAGQAVQVRGYYDHVVTVTAAEGRHFACSAGSEYTLRTRYRVAGFLEDKTGTVYLNETSYETVPGPCENNRRRLERYEGRLAGDELLLRWGGGAELLRRVAAVARPKN